MMIMRNDIATQINVDMLKNEYVTARMTAAMIIVAISVSHSGVFMFFLVCCFL